MPARSASCAASTISLQIAGHRSGTRVNVRPPSAFMEKTPSLSRLGPRIGWRGVAVMIAVPMLTESVHRMRRSIRGRFLGRRAGEPVRIEHGQRDSVDQCPGIAGLRGREDVGADAFLDDAAGLHDDDA